MTIYILLTKGKIWTPYGYYILISYANKNHNRTLRCAVGIFDVVFSPDCHLTSQLYSSKHTNCGKTVADLLPESHQDDIRICSHRLFRLADNRIYKIDASCFNKFPKSANIKLHPIRVSQIRCILMKLA